jgi:nucleotide-binding universal stress UspA family protein
MVLQDDDPCHCLLTNQRRLKRDRALNFARITTMRPFQSLLFAADFSDNSKEAFRLARSLAVQSKTRLTVFHVLDPKWIRDEPAYFGHSMAQIEAAPRDEDRHDLFKRYLAEAYPSDGPLDVQYVTNEGDVSAEILREAGEIGSDLIVMGTHGRTGIRRVLAGSVATAVLRGAHCPVLALRSGEGAHKSEEIRVILHATDFSAGAEPAAWVARSLAQDLQARLMILYVEPLTVFAYGTGPSAVDPQFARDAMDTLTQRLGNADLMHPVETRIRYGDTPDAIVLTADEVGCDLIVMGTHGRTRLGRLLMGSVAEAVMTRANCPVLIVKERRELPAANADQAAG